MESKLPAVVLSKGMLSFGRGVQRLRSNYLDDLPY
jgi:hypothetical protein